MAFFLGWISVAGSSREDAIVPLDAVGRMILPLPVYPWDPVVWLPRFRTDNVRLVIYNVKQVSPVSFMV